MKPLFAIALCALSVGACASPGTSTSMSMGGPGKVCRMSGGVGSAPGNRICASPDAWASYDKRLAASTSVQVQELAAAQGSQQRMGPLQLPPQKR